LPQIAILSGAVQSIASAVGILATGIPLGGAANDAVFATGQLATAIKLLAAAVENSASSGALTPTPAALSGLSQEQSTASAVLNTAIKLTADADAVAQASGDIQISTIDLAGEAITESTARGSITHGDGSDLPDIDPTSIVLVIEPRRTSWRQLFTKTVYLGFDNPVQIAITQSLTPLNFSAVVRMQLYLVRDGIAHVVDTNVSPDAIDWYSDGGGIVNFSLSGLQIEAGIYEATLIAFDPAHDHGQVLIEPNTAKLNFQFIQAVAA
jgi:hypothetical protein